MNSTKGSAYDQYCLSDKQLELSHHPLESFVFGKIVPPLIVLGIIGNIANFSVFVDARIKWRFNILLINLAAIDIYFLLLSVPFCLAQHRWFAHSYYFRLLYFASNIDILAALNWLSASSTWLMLIVSLERIAAVKWNFKTYDTLTLKKLARLVQLIVVIMFALSLYNHCAYHCPLAVFCNGTQPYGICIKSDSEKWIPATEPNPNSIWFIRWIRWSSLLTPVFVILVPFLLTCFSNAVLIISMTNRGIPLLKTSRQTEQRKEEMRATRTAIYIVTNFIITQGPSAVLNVVALFQNVSVSMYILTSFFVFLGKALTVVIFYTASASFRQRLLSKTHLSTRRRPMLGPFNLSFRKIDSHEKRE